MIQYNITSKAHIEVCNNTEKRVLYLLDSVKDDFNIYINSYYMGNVLRFYAAIWKGDNLKTEIDFSEFFGVYDVKAFINSQLHEV